MDLKHRIIEILSLVLQKDYTPEMEISRENEEAWDSLKHVEIIFALEDAFGINFNEDDMTQMTSVTAIAARIEAINEA